MAKNEIIFKNCNFSEHFEFLFLIFSLVEAHFVWLNFTENSFSLKITYFSLFYSTQKS